MSAVIVIVFVGLIVWGIWRFSTIGTHPRRQTQAPDLSNFAPTPEPPPQEDDSTTQEGQT